MVPWQVFVLCLSSWMGSALADCSIPEVMRGQWLSYEENEMVQTEIRSTGIDRLGSCVELQANRTNYKILLNQDRCYFCIEIVVRTINVLEKRQSGCYSNPRQPTMEEACREIDQQRELITLFNENFRPKICRSSIEGVWQFAYQDTLRATGECNRAGSVIRSCQSAGDQFLIANQQFNLTFERCSNEDAWGGTNQGDFSEGLHQFFCLGDWKVGKNHYFAVANTKESRRNERFRCFLKNRDDELILGKSITPECNVLKTPELSPARFTITPVRSESVPSGCELPNNFTGEWVNTANADADVTINRTHLIETYRPDEGRVRSTTYTCLEQQGNRYMMARQHIDGCQTDYVCFDFLPKHHNIIRFRRGRELVSRQFHTVCAWNQFERSTYNNQRRPDGSWLYNIMVAKTLTTIPCPVAGMFKFEQRGEIQFSTRILHGITDAPRPNIQCNTSQVSEFSACSGNQDQQTQINIDVEKCYSVDQQGLPQDIYSLPDYTMRCVGFWRENLRSYLITYDELDPISKYRCWVYLRTDINRIKMSQAVGSFCNINQRAESISYVEGAAVGLDLFENERERDTCPLYFDDGENPWKSAERFNIVFNFSGTVGVRVSTVLASVTMLLLLLTR